MLAVGVTGGIGSGKSLVCEIFRSLHIPVYHADTEARRIMDEEKGIKTKLVKYFGPQVYIENRLNRPWLASRVFSSEKDRNFVNSIVHPAVHKDFIHWKGLNGKAAYVIEEAALLFESGSHAQLDAVILVKAPVKLRLERIMKRDGLKRKEVSARMASQINPGEAEKMADHIIINDEKSFVLPQVLEIHQKILNGP